MGFISNKTCISKLKPGDHIYSWRTAFVYSHHGIYIGDNRVIHYTTAGPSSSPVSRCRTCGHQSSHGGVIRTCIYCFLGDGEVYLYKYDVSLTKLCTRVRGGTCSTAPSDPSEEVLHRASYLLEHGFSKYHLLSNNCEDFAIYCKTGLCVNNKGRSGQRRALVNGTVKTGLLLFAGLTGLLLFAGLGIVSMIVVPNSQIAMGPVFASPTRNAALKSALGMIDEDIGLHPDAKKVSVKDLVASFSRQED